MTQFWTPDKAKQLASLHAQSISHSEAASLLGCTRSMVSGKLRILGLTTDRDELLARRREKLREKRATGWRDPRYSKPREPKEKPPKLIKVAAKRAKLDAFLQAPIPPAESLGVGFMALTRTSCRWPVARGDDGHVFCGTETTRGRPYCTYHAWLGSAASENKAPIRCEIALSSASPVLQSGEQS